MKSGRSRLKSYDFRKERQSTWAELDRLVQIVEKKGIRKLNPKQLARLPLLYRASLSALSVARSISLDRALLEYLETLSGRAYFAVYGSSTRLRDSFGALLTHRFPCAVRRNLLPIGIAGAFMLLGVIVAWVLTARDPDWYYVFVGEGMSNGRDPAATTAELRETLYDSGGSSLATFASFLFTHNARVGFLAFTLGFLAGIPVYILMFTNGMVLGAFAALFASRGLGVDLWLWLLPHGVTELGAIILCGGAGLMLANAILFPGRNTRMANLARQGREAGVIAIGCVVLFLIAGLIEGFFRQLVTNQFARALMVVVTSTALLVYFRYAGRGRDITDA
jgi:uncharacterized membrane protein SpoIIM required for sporulation